MHRQNTGFIVTSASLVQPVTIRNALSWTGCSFFMLVFDRIGLHIVLVCSNMGRVMDLKVEINNSFCIPHLVDVSVLGMLSVCLALVIAMLVCCENISFGSRIFGYLVVRSIFPQGRVTEFCCIQLCQV